MFGLGVGLLIFGYGLTYTAAMNLQNGGKGPKLFEALGVTSTLSSPADSGVAQGSGSQVGPVPSPNQVPLPAVGGPLLVT